MRRFFDILAIGLLLGFFFLGLYGNPMGEGVLYIWIFLGLFFIVVLGWLFGLFQSTYDNMMQEVTRMQVAHARKKMVGKEKPSMEESFAALKKRDWKKAALGIWSSAEFGDLECQYCLSHLFRYGRGVPRSPRDGFRWLERAADAGHVDAEAELGDAYRSGYGGAVRPDGDKALSWLRTASLHGHDGAKYTIGRMYERGDLVRRDYEEASNWYRRAAERGLAHAQQALGKLYLKGRGVRKDNVQAAVWLGLAGRQKKPGVNVHRDLMHAQKDLKGEQLDNVRSLAGAWNERMVKTDFEKQEEIRRQEREKIRKLAQPFVDRVREELERLKEQTKDAILPAPEEQKRLPEPEKSFLATSDMPTDLPVGAPDRQSPEAVANALSSDTAEPKERSVRTAMARKSPEAQPTEPSMAETEKEDIKARMRQKGQELGKKAEEKALTDLKDQMRKMRDKERQRSAAKAVTEQDAAKAAATGMARPDKERPAAAQAMLERLKKERGTQTVRKNLRDRKAASSASDGDTSQSQSSARLTRTRRK